MLFSSPLLRQMLACGLAWFCCTHAATATVAVGVIEGDRAVLAVDSQISTFRANAEVGKGIGCKLRSRHQRHWAVFGLMNRGTYFDVDRIARESYRKLPDASVIPLMNLTLESMQREMSRWRKSELMNPSLKQSGMIFTGTESGKTVIGMYRVVLDGTTFKVEQQVTFGSNRPQFYCAGDQGHARNAIHAAIAAGASLREIAVAGVKAEIESDNPTVAYPIEIIEVSAGVETRSRVAPERFRVSGSKRL